MSFLSNAKKTIKLGSREFSFSPLTVDQLGELQDWVYSKLPDPIVVARQASLGQPEGVVTTLLSHAVEDVKAGARLLGTPEATALLTGYEGFRELLYLHSRKNHPDTTREFWDMVLTEAVEADMATLAEPLHEANGGAIPDPKGASSTSESVESGGRITSRRSRKTGNGPRKKSGS